MKQNANEGLAKTYWIIIASILLMIVLGAILWWYEGYVFYHK